MHKHEWAIRGAGFRCKDFPECGVQLKNIEVERRLNATEELSAEMAGKIASYIAGPTVAGKLTNYYKSLRAYIEKLEE